MIGANNMRAVDSLRGAVDSWLIVAVDSLTRANARGWIVLRVCCNPYVCACVCAHVCIGLLKLSKLSKLSTVNLFIYINHIVNKLIVCLKNNQTINQTINRGFFNAFA
jgi:hypothetical protein